MRLLLCGLYPTDELALWPIILEPLRASSEMPAAAESSTTRQSQMQDIQQMLQQRTQDACLPSEADPKRRFMHALATAALRQAPKVRKSRGWPYAVQEFLLMHKLALLQSAISQKSSASSLLQPRHYHLQGLHWTSAWVGHVHMTADALFRKLPATPEEMKREHSS